MVIAASNAGADRHPEWYYSVLNDAQVTFGGAPMQAAVVEQLVEQELLRTLAERVFPGFAVYRRDGAGVGLADPPSASP